MSKPFAPSPWLLQKMIDRAMAAADASVEQASLRQEARSDARAERAWVAEAKARRYARIEGRI